MENTLLPGKLLCKVYCDSSHYVAVPYIRKPSEGKSVSRFGKPDRQFRKAFEAAQAAKIKPAQFLFFIQNYLFEQFNVTYQFKAAWVLETQKILAHFFRTGKLCLSPDGTDEETAEETGTPCQTDVFQQFDTRFEEAFRLSRKEGLVGEKQKAWIRDYLDEQGEFLQRDDAFLSEKIKSQLHNLHNRRKRFRRKGFLNPWHYFVTITYDSAKMSEEEFRASLKRTFNNFHTRRGWKYMGCFERGGENERLHFHALVYIPKGQLVGKMKKVKRYSEKEKKMTIMDENSFFRSTYGINTFDPIQQETFKQGNVLNYILKYILKDGEKIIYGRGIPTELEKLVEDQHVAAEMVDFVEKFVLYDDANILCSEPDDLPEGKPEPHPRT